MALFRRTSAQPSVPPGERPGFAYLGAEDVYLDSACQTMRPQPVVDALTRYYTQFNACGERVKYAWGREVDDQVTATREAVLTTLGLSPRKYTTSFTLNTTYGLNLLLTQLPLGRYRRVVTTHAEHNSVFLSTIAAARRLGIPRLVLERTPDAAVQYGDGDLADAVVVVTAMNNVDGAGTPNLAALVRDTQRAGGIVIVDAAQAFSHAPELLRGVDADAVCFSAHKAYGASLGVVAASRRLLESLEIGFVGGGQVADVGLDDYTLLAEPHTRLEPGLQAWGEIVALRAALGFASGFRALTGETIPEREHRLGGLLFAGLSELPHLRMVNTSPSGVVSFAPERVDAHRLATFLSHAGVMVRSGWFCAHHWLKDELGLPPLARFSLGAHSTEADVARTLDVLTPLLRGL